MKFEQMEEYLSGVEGLPTLPLVLQQIQKVMGNPRSSMGQIAAIVAKDQALASRAIRLVNSAYYARTTPVASIQQAIIALGLNTLNNLMLGLSVVKMFSNSKILGYNPRAFWEHSFGTALLAKKIAVLLDYPGDKEECFIAGLLHDMGRLVMEQYLHNDFVKALSSARDHGGALLIREIEIFGFSHADVGGWLGRRWNIPMQIILAMELHHTPDRLSGVGTENDKKLIRIITMANELCLQGKIGASGEEHLMTNVLAIEPKMNTIVRDSLLAETRREVVSTLNEWRQL